MLIQNDHSTGVHQHPFTLFLDLITLDQKIRNIYDEISTLKSGVSEHLEQKKIIVERFDRFKRQVVDLRREIDALDLEMKSLEEQERLKRAQFEQARNIKEYQPLKKEIDALKRVQNEAERKLLTMWNKLEVSQKELEVQTAAQEAKVHEHLDAICQKQDRIAILQGELAVLNSDRPAKEAYVPIEWLEKYTHMRMNIADPVVPVMNASCSACFYSIASQEVTRLKRRAVVQCKGCFRLLYMPEAMLEQEIVQPK